MDSVRQCRYRVPVALRKESVDRNKKMFDEIMQGNPSLSARRAWIEIVAGVYDTVTRDVALRKESVDRNGNHTGINLALGGRSPQGERG